MVVVLFVSVTSQGNGVDTRTAIRGSSEETWRK